MDIKTHLGAVLRTALAKVAPEATDGLAFSGYGGIGATGRLARAGRLDVVPAQYSRLPGVFVDGTLPADILLLELAPRRDAGPPAVAVSISRAACSPHWRPAAAVW